MRNRQEALRKICTTPPQRELMHEYSHSENGAEFLADFSLLTPLGSTSEKVILAVYANLS